MGAALYMKFLIFWFLYKKKILNKLFVNPVLSKDGVVHSKYEERKQQKSVLFSELSVIISYLL